MIGGATTSKIHTAVKIAPHYSGPVIHVKDASQNPLIAAQLANSETRKIFLEQLKKEQEKEKKEHELQKSILDIKKKYGKNAILKGMNFEDGGTTIERNEQVGGHKG